MAIIILTLGTNIMLVVAHTTGHKSRYTGSRAQHTHTRQLLFPAAVVACSLSNSTTTITDVAIFS